MLLRQTSHELAALSRTPITLILSIGLPLLFFVLLSALVGNEVVDERGGVRVVQYLAPGMASFGVVMATFSFLAVGLAEARATGVVKRQAGTPAPRWVLVGGRIGAALVLGLTSTALVLVTGVVLYDLQVPSRSVLSIITTLVFASGCFSALGLALAGHHADIVAANQRIQTRNPSQRRLRRDQPELRFAAQRVLHVRFNADPHLNFVQPFSE